MSAADAIAIVGMACRAPGAPDVEALWSALMAGRVAVRELAREALAAAGVPEHVLDHPDYVRRKALLEDHDRFDAAFFGYSREEALRLDPQQRVFLEIAHAALEDAAIVPRGSGLRIGVFAGSGWSGFRADDSTHVAPDYVPMRVAYELGLEGPAMAVQTACSSALVAIHQACLSLLAGEVDAAIAGGVSVRTPQLEGYLWREGSIRSRRGRCTPFDADADGTVPGCGAGAVVLMRAPDAQDRDARALILGSATNNDGDRKVGFIAPSVDGQRAVIADAIAIAGVEPREIGLVEAHATGTAMGDAIELAALREVFKGAPVALGSVKANLGHLEAAGGVVALIKAALAVERGTIPGTPGLERPTEALGPLTVSAQPRPWAGPRIAGVSAFGFGGTNAHVVLGEAARAPRVMGGDDALLCASARTPTALAALTSRLSSHLAARPDLSRAQVAWTLGRGRAAHPRRAVLRGRAGAWITEADAPGLDEDARAWRRGGAPNWERLVAPEHRRFVSLPTYPFEET